VKDEGWESRAEKMLRNKHSSVSGKKREMLILYILKKWGTKKNRLKEIIEETLTQRSKK